LLAADGVEVLSGLYSGHDVGNGDDVADAYLAVTVYVGLLKGNLARSAGHEVGDADDVADTNLAVTVHVTHDDWKF
jgi:hypothetical protein